ncbi:MAG: hypothetical protein IAE89_11900 [Anaerolineae bacterium]|nr:hypothetical protein [Anaerolineae bacterium]
MLLSALFITGMLILSISQLARMMILISGHWKGPILRTCEPYAPEEPIFDPIPSILFWAGSLILTISTGLTVFARIEAPIYIIGALLMIIGFWIGQREREGRLRIMEWLPLPAWYKTLKERTTREERRHIAYMWLNLPESTRAHFNDSDMAFAKWVDLMIMSTVQQTVYDPVLEMRSQTYRHWNQRKQL